MKDNGIVIVFKILKWCVKTVLVVFGIVPMVRCGAGYQKKNGKVTFNGKEIANKNFVVLNDAFGKDDTAAYYKEYSISGADIKTFTALDRHYAKDANTVYYCDEEREGQNYYLTKHSVIKSIKGAKPATFTILGDGMEGYAKDSEQAYYGGTGFKVTDVTTLTVINGRFVKDQYAVYFDQVRVTNADPASFQVVNEFYAKDAQRVFYYGSYTDKYNGIHEVPCQGSSFSVLAYPYSKDDANAFYLYFKIPEADAKTFSVVGHNFAKDKANVYLKTKTLAGADAATFTIVPHDETSSLEEIGYTMDKNHIFWQDKMVTGANVVTFKTLSLGYAIDNNHVFHHASIVKNADPHTFTVYDHGFGDADAEDSRGKFLAGVKTTE